MNIYVSKLSFDTTSESLNELFAKYGDITSANIITDKATGFSRGFGFVEMVNDNDGKKAIEELDNAMFEGKSIKVSVARPRNDRNGGSWSNRSGRGFNSRY